MRIALRLNLDGSSADDCPITEMSRGMQRIHDRMRAGITVNGREFKNVKQLPPAYRQFYEELLAQALPIERAVDIVTRAEHSNYIKRTTTLGFIAVGCLAAIAYLWLHGYYA